jgi:predicted transcriptional regulator
MPHESVKKTINERQKEILIGAIANGESIRTTQVIDILNLRASRAREILAELVNEEILEVSGAKKNRSYRLKSKGK